MLCNYYNQLKKTARGRDIEGILEIVAKRRDWRGVYIIVKRRGEEKSWISASNIPKFCIVISFSDISKSLLYVFFFFSSYI